MELLCYFYAIDLRFLSKTANSPFEASRMTAIVLQGSTRRSIQELQFVLSENDNIFCSV